MLPQTMNESTEVIESLCSSINTTIEAAQNAIQRNIKDETLQAIFNSILANQRSMNELLKLTALDAQKNFEDIGDIYERLEELQS